MHQGSWDDQWVSAAFFATKSLQRFGNPPWFQLLLFFTMSDDAAATAPAAAVPAGAAPLTRGTRPVASLTRSKGPC